MAQAPIGREVVTVKGTEELAMLLKRASRSITVQEVNKIMVQAARPMVEMGKNDAMRVNPNKNAYSLSRSGVKYTIQPGLISKSIGTKVIKNKERGIVIVAPLFRKDPSRDPWFAHYIHEGTKERTYKGMSRGKIEGSAVVPFMDRAGGTAMRNMVANGVVKRLTAKLEEVGL